METIRGLLPVLSTTLRKGNCGRLGVLGGSAEYTGAPYFAGISVLKTGADLVHIFTPADAAPVIKSFSPDLIVHPDLDPGNWLQRLDALIVGPGLGRSEAAIDIARASILEAQRLEKPLVVDADGLWAVTERWEEISASAHSRLPMILTPNAVEMDRLAQKVLQQRTLDRPWEETRQAASALAVRLQIAIFVKVPADIFATSDGQVRLFGHVGAPRRPGGLGDILSGVLALFLLWSRRQELPIDKAAEAASYFVRECSRRAFDEIGRGMTAGDVIAQIAPFVKRIDCQLEKERKEGNGGK